MKKKIFSFLIGGILIFSITALSQAQEPLKASMQNPKDDYLIGEEQRLEIIVHVWGEVRLTGEKRVPDGTNILELISKAGGPTEYSDLSKILLFREKSVPLSVEEKAKLENLPDKYIRQDFDDLYKTGKTEIDIKKYLDNGATRFLPRLVPGDVVHVKRNVWFKWQTFIRVASQMAIIAQVWYWYSRIN